MDMSSRKQVCCNIFHCRRCIVVVSSCRQVHCNISDGMNFSLFLPYFLCMLGRQNLHWSVTH